MHGRARLGNWAAPSGLGAAEGDGDPGKGFPPERRSAGRWPLRSHVQQVFEPRYFAGFELDPALPSRTALEIVDGHGLAPQDEETPIGLAEPVVEARDGHPKPSRCLAGG